jgi:hypothetical protein
MENPFASIYERLSNSECLLKQVIEHIQTQHKIEENRESDSLKIKRSDFNKDSLKYLGGIMLGLVAANAIQKN